MLHRNHFFVALGGNASSQLDQNAAHVRAALGQFNAYGLHLRDVSGFWRTPAFPAGAGPDFVNACAVIDTEAPAPEVLNRLHAIEAAMGRERKTRWGQRVIDLDLLAQGDAVLPSRAVWQTWRDLPLAEQQARAPDQLILPHPRLHERGFVLVPLAQIAPDWRHPVQGRTVVEMRDALDPTERAEIRAL